jgi:hypothetical protein
MKLKSIVAASIVALTTLSSHAAATDWGTHDLLESSLALSPGGAVFDTYAFTLSAASTVASSITSMGNLAPATYSLWNADNTPTAFSWNVGGAPAVHSVNLAAGSYYYSVFATATGAAAYSINSAATVTAVPEPETYALLLAGLGVIGFVAKRRNKAV